MIYEFPVDKRRNSNSLSFPFSSNEVSFSTRVKQSHATFRRWCEPLVSLSCVLAMSGDRFLVLAESAGEDQYGLLTDGNDGMISEKTH